MLSKAWRGGESRIRGVPFVLAAPSQSLRRARTRGGERLVLGVGGEVVLADPLLGDEDRVVRRCGEVAIKLPAAG